MTDRLGVLKTYKLFIGGTFPRAESLQRLQGGRVSARGWYAGVRDYVTL